MHRYRAPLSVRTYSLPSGPGRATSPICPDLIYDRHTVSSRRGLDANRLKRRNLVMKFMPSITFQAIALVILSAVCGTHAWAQQVKTGDLVLDHAWARATPAGAKVGGGFLTIENKGPTPDKLVGASSPAAGKVEVHQTAMNNGVATMRPGDGRPINSARSIRHAGAQGLWPHDDGAERSAQTGR